MSKQTNIRIVDIARLAGVSPGTVDRIIHKRGHVSESKREKVEEVMREINYQPNMVARFLASKRSYRFAVVMPSFLPKEYWELVYDGIEKAVRELKDFNVSVQYLYFNQQDESSFPEIIENLKHIECDGVLLATLFGDLIADLSKYLDTQEIPYVYIDSNISGQKNLAYLGADSSVSGAVAAKLLLKEIGVDSDIIIGNVKYVDHYRKYSTQEQIRENGFRAYLEEHQFEGKIHYLDIVIEHKAKCSSQLRTLIDKASNKVGGVVFNSRIYEFAELFKDKNLVNCGISLIGYDLTPSNIEALLDDKVAYVISQRPHTQGYDAVKALSNYLIFGNKPNKDNFIPIDILIKENVEFYNNYKL